MGGGLKWCFRIKEGAKLVRPSRVISDSYMLIRTCGWPRAV